MGRTMTFSVIQGLSFDLHLHLHFKGQTNDTLRYEFVCLVGVQKGFGIFIFFPLGSNKGRKTMISLESCNLNTVYICKAV